MSEKGQGSGELPPVGTGTVLAEPGGANSGTTTAPPRPQYEGRQPTEAEREAGRWLDEPREPQKYEGRQPTEAEREAGRWLDQPTDQGSQPAGSGAGAATGSGEGGTEWIDEKTFMGPGGTPFEFQPTEGKPGGATTQPAPDSTMGEGVSQPSGAAESPSAPMRGGPPTDARGRQYGPAGKGPTQVLPPDIDPGAGESEGTVLDHTDTKGETDSPDDDQRPVMS